MSLILEIDGTRAIRDKIREGTIATDLMKPISLPLYFFSDGVGMTLLHAVLIVPSLILALLLVHIDVPRPPVLAAFVASFLLGYLVNFTLNFLMNAVAFWTLETFAIQLMVRWVSDLLS
jgi:ABC-2 type transport system permease protein